MSQSKLIRQIVRTNELSRAVAFIQSVIDNGSGLYLFTGDQGVGKSTTLFYCKSKVEDNIMLVFKRLRNIDSSSLSTIIDEAIDVTSDESETAKKKGLRYYLKLSTLHAKKKKLVLILDDVEQIQPSGAEFLATLLGMKVRDDILITVILTGEKTLNTRLDSSFQWGVQQHIKDEFIMEGLSLNQTSRFIDVHPLIRTSKYLAFSPQAVKKIHQHTGGHPGKLISIGADATAIARKHQKEMVSGRMVDGAISGNYKTPGAVASKTFVQGAIGLLLLLLIPISPLHYQNNSELEVLMPAELNPLDTSSVTTSDAEEDNIATEKTDLLTIESENIPVDTVASNFDQVVTNTTMFPTNPSAEPKLPALVLKADDIELLTQSLAITELNSNNSATKPDDGLAVDVSNAAAPDYHLQFQTNFINTIPSHKGFLKNELSNATQFRVEIPENLF